MTHVIPNDVLYMMPGALAEEVMAAAKNDSWVPIKVKFKRDEVITFGTADKLQPLETEFRRAVAEIGGRVLAHGAQTPTPLRHDTPIYETALVAVRPSQLPDLIQIDGVHALYGTNKGDLLRLLLDQPRPPA